MREPSADTSIPMMLVLSMEAVQSGFGLELAASHL
jgi:hypothetical protein